MASPSLLTGSPLTNQSAIDRRLHLVKALSELHTGCAARASPLGSSPSQNQHNTPNSAGRRLPLFPLPPPLMSPLGSSFDEGSDDELGSSISSAKRSIKRVRSFHSTGRMSSLLRQSSFHGANSPFGRPRSDPTILRQEAASARAPPPTPIDVSDVAMAAPWRDAAVFRPPPIRTMASLEPFDDGRASVASIRSTASSDVHLASLPMLRPPTIDTKCANHPGGVGLIAPPPTPRAGGSSSWFGGGRRASFGGATSMTGLRAHPTDGLPAMSLVAPGLYIGDEAAAANLRGLQAAGVTHVLNCCALPNPLDGAVGAPAHYLQLGLFDNTSDLPRMQDALGQGVEFISQAHAAGGTVLVHCHRGISRSATLAIAYLVRSTQQPAEQVFEKLRTKRKCIDPNLGYWVALKTWEQRVLPPALLSARASVSSPAVVRPLSRAG